MMSVGIDLVRISHIEESIAAFGERFMKRVFTEREIDYALASPSHTAARLAARFAAKEATVKALGMTESPWRAMEVVREESGAVRMQLSGSAKEAARNRALAVSLSHEGDYATAVVITEDHP